MADRLKNIPAQFLEFWNKYTKRQQIMIASVVAVVILALLLLWWVMSRPNWEQLGGPYSGPGEVSEITTLLKDNGINYSLSKDNLTVYVESKKLSDAVLLLGANNLPATSSILPEDVYNNSMTTTESDRKSKNLFLLQENIKKSLLVLEGIEDAIVLVTMKEQGSIVLQRDSEPFAAVTLTTNNSYDKSKNKAVANVVATAMGTTSLKNIRIADQNGLLFSGIDEADESLDLSSSYSFREQVKSNMALELETMVLHGRFADDAYILPNLKLEMDVIEQVYKEFLGPNGQTEGVIESEYGYNTESNSGGAGGAVGTDSNDGTTDYMLPDTATASGNTEIIKNEYKLSERITETIKDRGAIIEDESQLAVSLKRYRYTRQEDLEDSGALDDVTYEAYKLANSDPISVTEDENTAVIINDVKQLLSSATGIDANNIYVTLYDIPIFQDKIPPQIPWSLYLQIAMFILIAGLLVFVVFKGTAPVEVTELEPELSVEQLLATTKENQSLEDIEFSEKSETRKMIEKFVDENPEAVAQLLRNWLNEDWEG